MHLLEIPGHLGKLWVAAGFVFAAIEIKRDRKRARMRRRAWASGPLADAAILCINRMVEKEVDVRWPEVSLPKREMICAVLRQKVGRRDAGILLANMRDRRRARQSHSSLSFDSVMIEDCVTIEAGKIASDILEAAIDDGDVLPPEFFDRADTNGP